jgi:hypothetical protein
MEHEYLIQQEANMHMRTAQDEGRRDRLARSARAPRNSGGWMVFSAGLSRVAGAARGSAETIRAWLTSPSEPQEECC